MSEAREAIFARLRQQFARSPGQQRAAEQAVQQRLAERRTNLIPARGQLEPESRIELFCQLAQAVKTDVQRLAGLEEVPAAVADYLRRHNVPPRLVVAPDPLLDRAGWEREPMLELRRGTAVDADPVGVTRALAGIAETGTLLLASGPERPTLLAYLPETSVVVLAAGDIDGAYEQSWRRLRALPGWPPRSVNFITGPSRTGDIPPAIEFGAHGPRRLLVLIVDRMPDASH